MLSLSPFLLVYFYYYVRNIAEMYLQYSSQKIAINPSYRINFYLGSSLTILIILIIISLPL